MRYLEPSKLWGEMMTGQPPPKKTPLSYPGFYPTRIIYGWNMKVVYCGKPNARRVQLLHEMINKRRGVFFSLGEYDRNGLIGFMNFLGMFKEDRFPLSHDLDRWYYYHPFNNTIWDSFLKDWDIKRVSWPDKSKVAPVYWPLPKTAAKVSQIRAHRDWIKQTYMKEAVL